MPKDRYLVRTARPLSFAEMGFVTQLYLPIMGVEAYTLYQLLVHEVAEQSGAAAEHTHRGLMLMTSLSLDRLLAARERLEALGLLEVRKRENQQRDYFYEYLVKPPLTPAQFFQDYVLSLMLLNKIENHRFKQLRRQYADQLGAALDKEYPVTENLTKGFYQVFDSLKPSEIEVQQGSEREIFLTQMESDYPPAPMRADYEAKPNHQLSIASLRVNLPSNANAAEVLSSDNIEFFYKLQHFYQIDSWSLGYELSDWTLYKPDGTLDHDALRKRLLQKYTEDKLNREIAAAASPDEELAQGKLPEPGGVVYARICRQLSPLSLLERVVGGRISKAFLERAEGLLFSDGLPAEVVNVLLLHTLQSKNMELPRSYIETIRDSWKAKQITTVDEAVRLILERADARNQAAEKAKKPKKEGETAVRKNGRAVLQDKLPASVQRQLEREQGQSGKTAEKDAEGKSKTVMDDPELKALLDSLRKRQRGV
jgi:replication initiation and membrane attachment protein